MLSYLIRENVKSILKPADLHKIGTFKVYIEKSWIENNRRSIETFELKTHSCTSEDFKSMPGIVTLEGTVCLD